MLIDFIDFLYQPCPVLAVPLGWFIGLQDGRDQYVLILITGGTGIIAVTTILTFFITINRTKIELFFLFCTKRPDENKKP